MKRKKINFFRDNYKFIENMSINSETFYDYLDRLKKVAISIFEWENLPSSMNARYLEETLFYKGQASLLKDKKYGFINTCIADNGMINIYGLPSRLNCYSVGGYHSYRDLYCGLNPINGNNEYKEAILVMNNWDRIPTIATLELFAYRLYNAERCLDSNINACKTPILLSGTDKQKLMLENLYNQYNGNMPFIFGNKQTFEDKPLSVLKTDVPYLADKLMEYKKQIWNEALQFLGINSMSLEKRERMITDEANSNNEFINLNLESYLIPRQEACKQFNELFGLVGTDKEIKVKVRSDLYNIIKEEESIVTNIKPNTKEKEEVVENV